MRLVILIFLALIFSCEQEQQNVLIECTSCLTTADTGMIPNDGLNDTEALKAFLAGFGGKVLQFEFPKGDQFIIDSIEITGVDVVEIKGGRFILPPRSYDSEHAPMLTIVEAENVEFEGVVFDGGKDQNGYTWSLASGQSNQPNFLVEIQSPVTKTGLGSVRIEDCEFVNSLTSGVNIKQNNIGNNYGYLSVIVDRCIAKNTLGLSRMFGNFRQQTLSNSYQETAKETFPNSQSVGLKGMTFGSALKSNTRGIHCRVTGCTINGGMSNIFGTGSVESFIVDGLTVSNWGKHIDTEGNVFYYTSNKAENPGDEFIDSSTGFACKLDFVQVHGGRGVVVSNSTFLNSNPHYDSQSGGLGGSVWFGAGAHGKIAYCAMDYPPDIYEAETGVNSANSFSEVIGCTIYTKNKRWQMSNMIVTDCQFYDTLVVKSGLVKYDQTYADKMNYTSSVRIRDNVTMTNCHFWGTGIEVRSDLFWLNDIYFHTSAGITLYRDNSTPYDRKIRGYIDGMYGGGIAVPYRATNKDDGSEDINTRYYLSNIHTEPKNLDVTNWLGSLPDSVGITSQIANTFTDNNDGTYTVETQY